MGITNIPQKFYKFTHNFSELSRTKLQELIIKSVYSNGKLE